MPLSPIAGVTDGPTVLPGKSAGRTAPRLSSACHDPALRLRSGNGPAGARSAARRPGVVQERRSGSAPHHVLVLARLRNEALTVDDQSGRALPRGHREVREGA